MLSWMNMHTTHALQSWVADAEEDVEIMISIIEITQSSSNHYTLDLYIKLTQA